jgi:glycosyltransferase involved in cell wall biosynthesis
MRVALVTSYMPPHLGGIETIAETLFTGYRRAGVEVRWVASRVPAVAPGLDGCRIRVPCFNLVERFLGVPVPLWGFRGWVEVNRVVRWADAVHTLECLYMSSAIAVAMAMRYRKPSVVSQNIGFVHYGSHFLNWVERAAYATLGRAVLTQASHVVLATPTAVAHVSRLFGRALAHSCAFPIGIDTRYFRPASAGERAIARKELDLGAVEKVVLFAGRLVEKKGLSIVLDVSRSLPGIRFLVTGDGPLRHLLRGAPPNVLWRKPTGTDAMRTCYHAADCVLLPSHGEGLPLVVQEAMASGLPVVVSRDEPYAGDLLQLDICAGAERNAEAMTRVVNDILAGEQPRLGERARAYAVEGWSADTMVARYINLFTRLLADRKSSE